MSDKPAAAPLTMERIQAMLDVRAPGLGLIAPNGDKLYFCWRITGTPQVFRLDKPMGFPIRATSTQVGVYLIAFLPNVLGYGLLLARWLRGRPALLEFFSRSRSSAEPRQGEKHATRAPRTTGRRPHGVDAR